MSTARMCKAQENRSQNSKRTTKGICACYESNHTACNRTQRHYKGPSEITRGNGTKYNQNRVLAALSPFPYLLVRCHGEHRALHQTGKCCSTSAVTRHGTNEDNKHKFELSIRKYSSQVTAEVCSVKTCPGRYWVYISANIAPIHCYLITTLLANSPDNKSLKIYI